MNERPTEAVLELEPKGMRVSRRIVIKLCSVVSVGLIAYAALGPANWQLRPMLGWKTEHAANLHDNPPRHPHTFRLQFEDRLSWPFIHRSPQARRLRQRAFLWSDRLYAWPPGSQYW